MATGFESQASLVCLVFFFSLLFLKVKTRFLCTFEKRMMGLNPIVHPYVFINFLFQIRWGQSAALLAKGSTSVVTSPFESRDTRSLKSGFGHVNVSTELFVGLNAKATCAVFFTDFTFCQLKLVIPRLGLNRVRLNHLFPTHTYSTDMSRTL